MTFLTWNQLTDHDAMLIAFRENIWPMSWPLLLISYCVVLFACAVSIYGGDLWNG